MAEALGAAGSIVGIAAFGLQLSNTLRIYVEALIDYEDSIWVISLHIEATASALQRLHGLIQNDRTALEGAGPSLLKKDGLDEITSSSTQCKRVYEEIAVLIAKAAGQHDKKGNGQEGQVDLNALNNTTLYHRMRWPWLEPQIRRKQGQLRSIQNHILFYMNAVQLGQAMMSYAFHPAIISGSFINYFIKGGERNDPRPERGHRAPVRCNGPKEKNELFQGCTSTKEVPAYHFQRALTDILVFISCILLVNSSYTI